MPRGTLEVVLVCAKHLEDNNLFSGNDPYAILTVASQEKRSKTASGGGKQPEWNETFLFTVTDIGTQLHIKVMDKDTFTDDDFIGEADISLEPVLAQGSVPPTCYNLVREHKFRGEIKVSMTFHPENQEGYGDGYNGGYGERTCRGRYEEEYKEDRCNSGYEERTRERGYEEQRYNDGYVKRTYERGYEKEYKEDGSNERRDYGGYRESSRYD